MKKYGLFISVALISASILQARNITVRVFNAPLKQHSVTLNFSPGVRFNFSPPAPVQYYMETKRAFPGQTFQQPGVQIDEQGIFSFVFKNVPDVAGRLSLQRIDRKQGFVSRDVMGRTRRGTKLFT